MNGNRSQPNHQHISERCDPRNEADFCLQWYPKADGKDAPPADSTDRQDRIRLKFLAAYYNINKAYAHLLEIRRIHSIASAEGKTAELEALRAIEVLLCERDALEDEFAPVGIIAEPVSLNGFTIDLKFTLGAVQRSKFGPHDFYSSTYISIPLPAGVEPEQKREN